MFKGFKKSFYFQSLVFVLMINLLVPTVKKKYFTSTQLSGDSFRGDSKYELIPLWNPRWNIKLILMQESSKFDIIRI